MRKILFGFLIVLVAFGLIGFAGFLVWTSNPYQPMPEARAALESDANVQVQKESWLVFKPRASEPTTGLILYPGGLVDYRAYAPAAKSIAAQGYLVVIVPMPFNLAFFDANRANDVIAKYPAIKRWAIGGHSLGGVAAAMYVKSNPNAVNAIVFWASYPAESMVDSRVIVMSIYGTNDGGIDQLRASRHLMPASTRWVEIQGGNHAQFGYYGMQAGDGTASISREEQQKQIVSATIELLEQLGN